MIILKKAVRDLHEKDTQSHECRQINTETFNFKCGWKINNYASR